MFDAGMQFWYVLMSSQNFSGLYCMGIHTSRANCYNPMMTIGSAADSTYEYMLKQWVMSNHTQDVSHGLKLQRAVNGSQRLTEAQPSPSSQMPSAVALLLLTPTLHCSLHCSDHKPHRQCARQ